MSLQPLPEPSWIYRGPLRFMTGSPSTQELLLIVGLALVGSLLLVIAFGRIRRYATAVWNGPGDPSPWWLPIAGIAGAVGVGLLVLLGLQLDSIAGRMGIGIAPLVLLLLSEGRRTTSRR